MSLPKTGRLPCSEASAAPLGDTLCSVETCGTLVGMPVAGVPLCPLVQAEGSGGVDAGVVSCALPQAVRALASVKDAVSKSIALDATVTERDFLMEVITRT